MIIGKNYYEESQKLFSTGNDELDDILEEVYYSGIEDGYDYAQKEFANARKVKKAVTMATKDFEKAIRDISDKDQVWEVYRKHRKKFENKKLIRDARKGLKKEYDEVSRYPLRHTWKKTNNSRLSNYSYDKAEKILGNGSYVFDPVRH